MKRRRPLALLAHADPRTRSEVEFALDTHGVDTVCARTCRDISAVLASRRRPDVIFTGSSFAHGNWREVVSLARAAAPPVDVVVSIDEPGASSGVDDGMPGLDALEAGAFDFVVLPFGANVAQVLAHRFAKPRVLQPRLWRNLNLRARRATPLAVATRNAWQNPWEVLARAWHRSPKARPSGP
jgi:DNA-binding NtrC family response regulator